MIIYDYSAGAPGLLCPDCWQTEHSLGFLAGGGMFGDDAASDGCGGCPRGWAAGGCRG